MLASSASAASTTTTNPTTTVSTPENSTIYPFRYLPGRVARSVWLSNGRERLTGCSSRASSTTSERLCIAALIEAPERIENLDGGDALVHAEHNDLRSARE